jgi:purine-binding chemotaxis protein CheW
MSNETKKTRHFILFEVNSIRYGIDSTQVKQIEMIGELTPLPNSPDFIDGLVFSRGEVVPVINLRKKFGFDTIEYDVQTRLIVVKQNEASVGLVVDSAKEFITVPVEKIEAVPDNITGISGKYMEGTILWNDRMIIILNPEPIVQLVDTSLNINQ